MAQVIDLTGSDDEDDDSPVRPAKRPALNAFNRPLPGQEPRNLHNTGLSNGATLTFASQTSSESPAQTGGYDA